MANRKNHTPHHPTAPYLGASGWLYASNAPYLIQQLNNTQNGELKDADHPLWEEVRKHAPHEHVDEVPSWARNGSARPRAQPTALAATALAANAQGQTLNIKDSIQALLLIRNYRALGHLAAKLDPLAMSPQEKPLELKMQTFGFHESDCNRQIFLDNTLGLQSATLKEIIDICERTYCGSVGIEYMHVTDPKRRAWIQKRVESLEFYDPLPRAEKMHILEQLVGGTAFEKFLDKKYQGAKRFGLDGGESFIPLVQGLIRRGAKHGLTEMTFGTAHRGRLNFLTNVLEKPYHEVFAEFNGLEQLPADVEGSGDVKYHLGQSSDIVIDGQKMHFSLVANPSHLEAVNTSVLGKVRAKQDVLPEGERQNILGVLVHGDAAFAGQGVVSEALAMSQLGGYQTGGTIHIIINNQIGFTTNPNHSRSSPYCSDIGKMVAPIIHVNGDDPECCVRVAQFAMDYRQEFASDIIIDMICYRRHGHNEADEPMYTQPAMYKKIAQHPSTLSLYAQELSRAGLIEDNVVTDLTQKYNARFENAFEAAKTKPNTKPDWLEGVWEGLKHPGEAVTEQPETGVDLKALTQIGTAITAVPSQITVHAKIKRQLAQRQDSLLKQQRVDWASAELLAYGSLLLEGKHVRLSGEDCQRGTFSHRHAVLFDQEEGDRPYVPLNHIDPSQAKFEVINSPLSEFGVLGFEYGYSLAQPHSLVLWEAQFGDFANGAQVIIDQFVASGETKWLRFSGLVMLLPHGFEGQGPEHSSARLERYLQLCADNNLQVINLTSPANFFHALRRQILRDFRRPLIVMSPKSLLRRKTFVSTLPEIAQGTRFEPVLADHRHGTDALASDDQIERVIICSGKIYFDLYDELVRKKLSTIRLLRLEEMYPFPRAQLTEHLRSYPRAEVVWCQEEPENNGAWGFVDRKIEEVLTEIGRNMRPRYIGRKAAASPATGFLAQHNKEQQHILRQATTL